MVNNNNNTSKASGSAANGHVPNGQLATASAPPVSFLSSVWSWADAIWDFLWFIICSIGYIIQDLYYIALGYPEKELNTDIALITGGGNGLGRLLAQRLGKMGSKVVIWDISEEGIKETIEMVEAEGGYCKGYVVDISKKEEVYKAAEVIRNEIGDVSLLINNAGVVSGRLLLDTPDHLIERSFNVNVMAHFWTTKAFLPKMIEHQRGHIATIASLAGHVGITKLVDYCASKFAAVGFDEALRLELDVLGHSNIQTTCICPFFIQATGMFDDVNARWVPTLNPNAVADRIIVAIKKNEKITIIPGYIRLLLTLKWTFPWGCVGGLLRRLVPDAAPHGVAQKPLPTDVSTKQQQQHEQSVTVAAAATKVAHTSLITKHTTDLCTDFSETLPKTASLLVQRTPSLGERVL
ncbi:PREDICTED: estradiol 17-beta-dehydrogenase 11 [Bactrocera latifrons]|uniref:Short-chain dehydrogenase/reductase family 16C member 6 n=2 Tax=Bactrocera latifrons TaxID=174628 RepID=A0A0K8WHU1_BACLA|nr:PREDICTED: estradiol 17-beta-dehydrogenase 11 [Bactrocera latifrons]XP_018796865.1 PREDICTED: estradiol 17-beta-dehydrogenase 11 [Bactrocera latifrons]